MKDEKTVTANKILMWYSIDFGTTPEEVKATLAKYHNSEDAKKVLLNKSSNLEFRDYDWDVNKA